MVTARASAREQHRLPRSILALEVGDWCTTLELCSDGLDDGHLESAMLAVVLRTAAGGICALAAGDLASARRQFFDAAALLPAGLTRPGRDGRRLASLTSEPSGAGCSANARWTWQTARIVWREQSLIADLITQLIKSPAPRDHMVQAYIQFMFEVEFSPFAWYRPTKECTLNDPPVTPTRIDMCRRASNLRKLAVPMAGDVSKNVWLDIGGHRGLRAEAQARLADRPLTPWATETSLRGQVPVRLGRRRAWNHAQLWKRDLDYENSA
jgi:hypothetical protein